MREPDILPELCKHAALLQWLTDLCRPMPDSDRMRAMLLSLTVMLHRLHTMPVESEIDLDDEGTECPICRALKTMDDFFGRYQVALERTN